MLKKDTNNIRRVEAESILHGYLQTIKQDIDELSSHVLCFPILSVEKIRTFCAKTTDDTGEKYLFSAMLAVYLCYLESYTVQKYSAEWKNNTFLAFIPNGHVVKQTGIGLTAVKKYKSALIKIGLIDVISKKSQKMVKTQYLRVKFIPDNESLTGILGLILRPESIGGVGTPTTPPVGTPTMVGTPTTPPVGTPTVPFLHPPRSARRPLAITHSSTSTSTIGIITSRYLSRHPCLRHESNGLRHVRLNPLTEPVSEDQTQPNGGKRKMVKHSSPAHQKERVTYGVSKGGDVIDHNMVVGAITLLLQVVPTDAEAYAKKTTRKAVIDLLKVRTLEQIGAVVNAVLSKQGEQYFPVLPYNVLSFAKGWSKYEQASMRNTAGQAQSTLRNIPGYNEAYSGGPKTKKDRAYVQWVKARKTRQIPEDLTFDAYVVNNNIDINEN